MPPTTHPPDAVTLDHNARSLVRNELDGLVRALRSYLYLEDTDVQRVRVTLAAAVSATLEHAEPFWLMNIGAPGAGKTTFTDVVLAKLADIAASSLTKPGVLSVKQVGRGANTRAVPVGILAGKDGESLLVYVKDFSSMLGADARSGADRADLYSCLREVYDGSFHVDNHTGSATWSGRVTMVANATNAVERYAAHEGALGDRWVRFKLPERSPDALRAISQLTRRRNEETAALTEERARDLAEKVAKMARGIVPDDTTDEVAEYIREAGVLAALGRSNVPRDGYGKRDIVGLVEFEDSTRLVKQLTVLARCEYALGLHDDEITEDVRHLVMSSIPTARLRALDVLSRHVSMSGSAVARAINVDRKTAYRTLGDLRMLGLVASDVDPEDVIAGGLPIEWRLASEHADVVRYVLDPPDAHDRIEAAALARLAADPLDAPEDVYTSEDAPEPDYSGWESTSAQVA